MGGKWSEKKAESKKFFDSVFKASALCQKSPRKKKVFFFTFFGLLRFLVFFNGLLAPTSRSRMSNIFRDSESLGKSNVKKWSQI
jgi:hypothetical protein